MRSRIHFDVTAASIEHKLFSTEVVENLCNIIQISMAVKMETMYKVHRAFFSDVFRLDPFVALGDEYTVGGETTKFFPIVNRNHVEKFLDFTSIQDVESKIPLPKLGEYMFTQLFVHTHPGGDIYPSHIDDKGIFNGDLSTSQLDVVRNLYLSGVWTRPIDVIAGVVDSQYVPLFFYQKKRDKMYEIPEINDGDEFMRFFLDHELWKKSPPKQVPIGVRNGLHLYNVDLGFLDMHNKKILFERSGNHWDKFAYRATYIDVDRPFFSKQKKLMHHLLGLSSSAVLEAYRKRN